MFAGYQFHQTNLGSAISATSQQFEQVNELTNYLVTKGFRDWTRRPLRTANYTNNYRIW